MEGEDDARQCSACSAEVEDATGGGQGDYVTCLCWISFMAAVGESGGAAGERKPPAVLDLCIAVGTSAGRLRVYAPDGSLLISQRLHSVGGDGRAGRGSDGGVRALHLRDARRSPSRDDPCEDLTAVLDAAVVRIDALELRSAIRRAALMGPVATAAAAKEVERLAATTTACGASASASALHRGRIGRGSFAGEEAHASTGASTCNAPPLTVSKWDLSRLSPLADAVCVGRLPPSMSQLGLAPDAADGGGGGAHRRGIGLLAAGVGDPRGSSGVVALLTTHEDRENILEAATALATKVHPTP